MPTIANFAAAGARAYGHLGALKAKVLQTLTFFGDTSWVAPAGVAMLPTVSGRGANGTAAYDTTVTTWHIDTVSIRYYHYPDGHTEQGASNTSTQNYSAEPTKPSDYCSPPVSHTPNGIDGYDSSQLCYYFFKSSTTSGSSSPGATGASATAFGRTFPGGTPSVVTPGTTTVNNITITPLASYPIVVPAGGSLTITFYQ